MKTHPMIKHLRSKGVTGWVILRGAGTWYGPYATKEQAQRALTRKDEWGDPVTGRVMEVPR